MQLPNEIKRNVWFKMGVPVKTAVYQLNSSRVKKRKKKKKSEEKKRSKLWLGDFSFFLSWYLLSWQN